MRKAIARRQFKSNTTSTFRDYAQAVTGTYDQADTLHNIYLDYGYPDKVTFAHCWNMYRRFGIAKNVVMLPTNLSWLEPPEVLGNSQFMADLETLVKKQKLWQRLKALDSRQRVGRYAGLFFRVRDGQAPDQPIENILPGVNAIANIVPIYEGNLRVLTTDTDPMSETYGMPTMYQYTSNAVGNKNEFSASTFNIHPDRLVIAAEGAEDGGIYGESALETPFNSLMDLRKIIGACGEGFYRNAAQAVLFSIKDTHSALSNSDLLDDFNDEFDDFTYNRFRRGLWLPGLEPQQLDARLENPKEFFNAALNDVAASSEIPATILIGQQTGRLASTEDSRNLLSRMNSRRTNFLTALISTTIDWLIVHGVLPFSDYEIEWSDLLEQSDEERLNNATKMSNINREQFLAGRQAVFTEAEIREQAGYEEQPETDFEDMDDDESVDEDMDDGSED